MRTLDDIANEADSSGSVFFPGNLNVQVEENPFAKDALFQPALLGICILIVLKSSKKPKKSSDVFALVARMLVESYPSISTNPFELLTSITLRHKIAETICLLESLKMVVSDENSFLAVESNGKEFIKSQKKIEGKKRDLFNELERKLLIVRSKS